MTAKKIQKSYFDVLGLCCSSEIPLIEKILKPINGVQEVSVIVASRTVIVLHDNLVISQLQIVNALNQARLEASVRAYGEANYSNKWPSPYAIACGLFLVLSLLKYVYHPLRWFAIVAVIIGILPIILKGYAALRNFTLDTNILVLIAVMGSIALRDYWEAASIVFLFTIAQWLESRASHKATAVMSSLMNMVPQKAVLAETGEEVDASEVIINTILAVKPGENIPIDGIVVDGKCEVDEKTLTGESYPVFKKTDSIVWAGTINLNGYISVKTTALAENCAVAKMAKLVEEAQNNKSKTQRFIDKCAKFYTPAIVAISIGLAAIPAILKVHNQRHWFHLALVVLVSACPCALILSTPVATFCALSKAATIGLLIKGGEYLETLSKIKIMGFDKTGTITRGEFLITEFQCLVDDVTIDKLLYWVSSIESKSSHPMAAALTDYGRSLSIEPKPENVEEFENFPGEGVFGKIDGKYIYVGNRKIASRAGCETVGSLSGYIGEGKSIGYIFLGGVSVGVFSLSDTCRSGAKEAINQLKTMGIKTAMLTGDSNEAAIIAQNQLEGALEVIKAELLPQDKVNIIKEFQKQAPTAMVGDGLNDAPALATADIGISMGVSGSALATDTCHVILMSNDITKIPLAIKLARKTKMKIVQNVIFSILTKVAILALAFAGYPLVWAAVLADVGTCLIVIFNSMLLLKGKEEPAKWSSWKRFFGKKGCGSHSHGNNDCHKHDHSSDVHKHHCSKTCDDHVKDSKPSQTKGCCAPVDHLKQTKHSSVEHKHQCSLTPCGDHEKGINFSKTKGCCESYSGHNRIKSIEKNSNIDGQTNGCSHDHNTGYNCEHIHLCSSVSKSCETETCIDSVNKHEHCHLKHCTPKSEELSCVHDKVANVCGVTNDCSSSSEKKHVAPCCQSISKKCCDRNIKCGENVVKHYSEKKHVAPCCQSISKKCCDRNIICGENVVKLSEIVVQ